MVLGITTLVSHLAMQHLAISHLSILHLSLLHPSIRHLATLQLPPVRNGIAGMTKTEYGIAQMATDSITRTEVLAGATTARRRPLTLRDAFRKPPTVPSTFRSPMQATYHRIPSESPTVPQTHHPHTKRLRPSAHHSSATGKQLPFRLLIHMASCRLELGSRSRTISHGALPVRSTICTSSTPE